MNIILVIIDNYDSFTYNLVQYFGELGADIKVVRNDTVSIEEIETLCPSGLVISPGPCSPNEAGISLEAIRYFSGKMPILGVCLGHQCIGQAFGGQVRQAQKVMHGKLSKILHNGKLIFNNIPNEILVTRYHSLVLDYELPDCIEVMAYSHEADKSFNEIMAIAHKQYPIVGVQFHPESIRAQFGKEMIKNFLDMIIVHQIRSIK